MLKRVVLILAIVALSTSLVAGNDPWKDKPYKQWDAKDIQKIMTDSPWCHSVSVLATWNPSLNPSSSTPAAPVTGAGGYDNPNAGSGGGMTRSPDNPSGTGSQVLFYVRWASALTVRQSMARNAMLKGTPEEKADQIVSRQLDLYVISVQGTDMTPFSKMEEAALKQGSYLLMKKTKQKLTPDRVEIHRAPNSQNIVEVSFYFAKKTATGEAVIPSDEKQLEFACDTNLTRLKTSFDLTKMTGPNGADL
jgi:hypothetical protein